MSTARPTSELGSIRTHFTAWTLLLWFVSVLALAQEDTAAAQEQTAPAQDEAAPQPETATLHQEDATQQPETVPPPQERGPRVSPSLSVDIGYSLPVGDWTQHRFAQGVEQFGGGLIGLAEFETRIFSVPFAAYFGYSKLDVSDWVQYAQSQGDDITASASFSTYGLVLRPYLIKRAPSFLSIDIGAGYFDFKGTETFQGYVYDYDFLHSGMGFVTGIFYKHLLGEKTVLRIGVRGFVLPAALSYADGVEYDIYFIPITLGLGFVF